MPRYELLSDRDQRNHVERAFSHYDVPVPSGHHVAHDAATGGDRPRLDRFGLRIEANERVRFHGRFAVPDRSVQKRDSIRLRPRPTWRREFLHRAGFWI